MMATARILGMILAGTGLAACGGGGGGSPFVGPVFTAVSATLSGTTNSQVLFGSDVNGNILIQLPDGDLAVLDPASLIGSRIDSRLGGAIVLEFVSTNFDFIEAIDSSFYAMFRINDIDTPLSAYEAYAAIGDETVSLPTGTATYAGRFISSSFVGGSISNVEDFDDVTDDFIYGDADIFADFGTSTVDVTLTFDALNPAAFAGGTLTGTGLGVVGSQYSGNIAGTTPDYVLAGTLNGAFYGPTAEQTAGTFSADDTALNAEIVGGFGADKI